MVDIFTLVHKATAAMWLQATSTVATYCFYCCNIVVADCQHLQLPQCVHTGSLFSTYASLILTNPVIFTISVSCISIMIISSVYLFDL